jgi:FixJ family two-component response regulator
MEARLERQASDATIHVIDADDLSRNTTESLLKSAHQQVIGCHSADSFFEHFDPAQSACVLIDLESLGIAGLQIQDRLRDVVERVPVILTIENCKIPVVTKAMRAGAWDVVQKPIDATILKASVQEALEVTVHIRQIAAPQSEITARLATLSKREHEVLDLLIQGHTNRSIASQLGNSCWTVEKQRSNLMRKMHAKTLPELAMMYYTARFSVGSPQHRGLLGWKPFCDRGIPIEPFSLEQANVDRGEWLAVG